MKKRDKKKRNGKRARTVAASAPEGTKPGVLTRVVRGVRKWFGGRGSKQAAPIIRPSLTPREQRTRDALDLRRAKASILKYARRRQIAERPNRAERRVELAHLGQSKRVRPRRAAPCGTVPKLQKKEVTPFEREGRNMAKADRRARRRGVKGPTPADRARKLLAWDWQPAAPGEPGSVPYTYSTEGSRLTVDETMAARVGI